LINDLLAGGDPCGLLVYDSQADSSEIMSGAGAYRLFSFPIVEFIPIIVRHHLSQRIANNSSASFQYFRCSPIVSVA